MTTTKKNSLITANKQNKKEVNKLLICSNHGDDWRVAPFLPCLCRFGSSLLLLKAALILMVVQRPAGGAKNSLWRQWLVQPQRSLGVSHLARTWSLYRLVFGSSSEWVISLTDDLGEFFLSRMAGNAWRSLVRSTVFIPGFRPPNLCVLEMNGAVCVCWSLCLSLYLSLRALCVFFGLMYLG